MVHTHFVFGAMEFGSYIAWARGDNFSLLCCYVGFALADVPH